MNTFPLFNQKQIISSLLTLIMIIITSAIIPTITTIINKTTDIEHPPYNTGGGAEVGGMAYPWGSCGGGAGGAGAWLISKTNVKSNESVTSSRPDSSEDPTRRSKLYHSRSVVQKSSCREQTPLPSDTSHFHFHLMVFLFRNINALIDG